MVVSANGLFALPPDADPQQLSMLAINPPTAALLLSEYVNLKPGEWVVQNSANSAVGRWVIAFAKTRGLKTVNIVRRRELVPELQAIGADVVVVDSPDVSKEIKAAVGQCRAPPGARRCQRPGDGRARVDALAHGTLVILRGDERRLRCRSARWTLSSSRSRCGAFGWAIRNLRPKVRHAIAQAAEMIASGRVQIPVAATYPLSSIKEAVAHALRGGKILLDVAGSAN